MVSRGTWARFKFVRELMLLFYIIIDTLFGYARLRCWYCSPKLRWKDEQPLADIVRGMAPWTLTSTRKCALRRDEDHQPAIASSSDVEDQFRRSSIAQSGRVSSEYDIAAFIASVAGERPRLVRPVDVDATDGPDEPDQHEHDGK